MKYAVKTSKSSSINWCDNVWYERCDYDNFQFTLDEAMDVVQKLRNHYQYYVTILSEDGHERFFEFGREMLPENIQAEVDMMLNSRGLDDPFEISMF